MIGLGDANGVTRVDIDEIVQEVRAGTASRERVLRALELLNANGEEVPQEIEWQALNYFIADNPDRIDLKRSFVTVSQALAIEVPDALLAAVRESYIDEEYETDFQDLLADYAKKAGMRDMEAEFFSDMAQVRAFTMTTVERLYALWQVTGSIGRSGLPGDFVEAGVWRGGSVMLMALALMRAGCTDRKLCLFDTFTGLPEPDPEKDVDSLGNKAIDGWTPRNLGEGETYWAYATEKEVRKNLASTGYPDGLFRFVPGQVEETLPSSAPTNISLLRIDTDWHSSYQHLLHHLYDRVVPGGYIFLDDYGQFLGARNAVDEFRRERRIVSPLLRIDYSCRLMIKP